MVFSQLGINLKIKKKRRRRKKQFKAVISGMRLSGKGWTFTFLWNFSALSPQGLLLFGGENEEWK